MNYPTDLKYSKTHEWVKEDDGLTVVGISDFAQDSLGDIVFIGLPSVGDTGGTAIYAADGGTVTYSGWRGGYGYLVIIDHGNGYQTYYGHNSSLVVSAGEHVYKGQQIARMGSTGVSSGNHCHFGILINGTFVNPLNYL